MGFRADELFERLYATRGTPSQIDGGIGKMAVTVLEALKSPLLWIPVQGPDRLEHMLPAAQHRFVGRSEQGTLFCAAYTDESVCPLPRLYFWLAPAAEEHVWHHHFAAVAGRLPRWERDELAAITPAGDAQSLLAAFNRAEWAAAAPALYEYLQGRKANTTLRGAVYQNTRECLVHESGPAHPSMMTLVLEDGAGALIVDLCEQCRLEIARDNTAVLEYLSKKLDLPPLPFALRPATREDLLAHAEGVMAAELACTNIVLNESNSTLSGDRASGFTVKIRMESPGDYAYMLEEPAQDRAVRRRLVRFRFDAAPDHPDVPFAPHHLHPDTRTRKGSQRNIAPSFLFGLPKADVPAFLREIEKHEAAHGSRQEA